MLKTTQRLSLFLLLFILNCAPRIALYNETAYQNAVNLKVESLSLMENAIDSIGSHTIEISDLEMKINKAYQYVMWLPRNELTVKQWEILMKPDGGLLGEFLKRWKEETVLNRGYIDESKIQVDQAYNEIIKLETGKVKPQQ
jgi:hypothetical protein